MIALNTAVNVNSPAQSEDSKLASVGIVQDCYGRTTPGSDYGVKLHIISRSSRLGSASLWPAATAPEEHFLNGSSVMRHCLVKFSYVHPLYLASMEAIMFRTHTSQAHW